LLAFDTCIREKALILAVKAFEAEELNQGLFSAGTRNLIPKNDEEY
jgi:hypothetical protein